ncbi:hypothetical protein [Sulfurospirillum oryzae]|uniref:hypothetical protein n=1 Tax=Sulfurospirillum oryzae TaxID=2976535 RepID=UPI0021E884CD|nr:hypothetical protein [Sulfurospirillum oryzae]
MSEVYSIFLSAVFSSFIVTTGIIAVVGTLYYLTYKCFASYISFDKIAQSEKLLSEPKSTTVGN